METFHARRGHTEDRTYRRGNPGPNHTNTAHDNVRQTSWWRRHRALLAAGIIRWRIIHMSDGD